MRCEGEDAGQHGDQVEREVGKQGQEEGAAGDRGNQGEAGELGRAEDSLGVIRVLRVVVQVVQLAAVQTAAVHSSDVQAAAAFEGGAAAERVLAA